MVRGGLSLLYREGPIGLVPQTAGSTKWPLVGADAGRGQPTRVRNPLRPIIPSPSPPRLQSLNLKLRSTQGALFESFSSLEPVVVPQRVGLMKSGASFLM